MPNCHLILARHCGPYKSVPSPFVAGVLAPLIQGKMGNGNSLHVIHDRVPIHSSNPELLKNFDKLVYSAKFMRAWKKLDSAWREAAKACMAKADRGEDSFLLNREMSPEAMLILKTNKKMPNTIMNHAGFYPFEAAIEQTRHRVELELAVQMAKLDGVEASLRHLMATHEAIASGVLLRDAEMMKQISHIGSDVVVIRGFNHLYLTDIEDLDIPIAPETGGVVNFNDMIKKFGITLKAYVEPGELSFAERAVNVLCTGEIDPREHKTIALLDMIFVSFMNQNDEWHKEGGFERGIAHTLTRYGSLVTPAEPSRITGQE